MKSLPTASQTTDHPEACPLNAGWFRQLVCRVRILWVTKMTGTILGMTLFFVLYFQLLKHPLFPIITIPVTMVDRLIGFRPEALPLYLSLWIYVPLASALLKNRRELVIYSEAAVVLSAISFGIYLFWPTAVPKAEIDWSQHPAFLFLKTVDASGNACPSLHAAFAVFTAVWFQWLLRGVGAGGLFRAFNWLWCLGILYSTIATRQHVAIDILCGAVLGAMVATLFLRHRY